MYDIEKSKEIELLQHLLKHPAMYVGKNRLDYLICFYDGAMFSKYWFGDRPIDNTHHCNPDFHMQRWLFLKESASIIHAATITGQSLFERCYGIDQKAIDMFREMLDDTPFDFDSGSLYRLEDTVAKHIYQIYSFYYWHNRSHDEQKRWHGDFNPAVSSDYYPVSDSIQSIIGDVHQTYASIIPLINRMIHEPYNNLWIYIHYEHYFMQVRFLYYSGKSGWVDNTSLVHHKDYYHNLVILHAYAAIVQKEEHKNHIITLHSNNGIVTEEHKEMSDDWYGIFNNGVDISVCNTNTFCKSYSEWKMNIVQ